MCADLFPTGEPYRLQGHRLAFTNWTYIRPATFGWFAADGTNVTVYGDCGPDEAIIRHYHRPYGITVQTQAAQRSGRILSPEKPWEDGNECFGTVIHEGERYRAWGNVNGWGDLATRGEPFFCYFESADGLQWERPNCGLLSYQDYAETNLLARWKSGGSVFLDPSAPPTERYKWIAETHFSQQIFEDYAQRYPERTDPRSHRRDAQLFVGVEGAVSPDGRQWTLLPEPLVMTHSDTQIVAYYDAILRKYVGYFRDFQGGSRAEDYPISEEPAWLSAGRRAIGRAETDDFRSFPLPQRIIEPGPDLSPSEVYYTNCRTTVPGAPEQHLLFPAVYDQVMDRTSIVAFSSADGRVWHRLPGGSVLETAAFGAWDGGCIFAVPNLIELPNGDFALPYTGYDVPHKYPRKRASRSTGYALWPKGRLAGVAAKERGEFTTVRFIPPGRRLRINAVTARGGCIRIECLDDRLQPIPGREMTAAIPLSGDLYQQPVTWRNTEAVGGEEGQAVALRLSMDSAVIYHLDFF
ncbi:MAG: hypothetical protein ACYC7E_06525 [Armatimonadota bacterium]